ncbi:MAG: McrB family protein [Vicinamibacterales bacterium]
MTHDLKTDEGLRAALESVREPVDENETWSARLAGVLDWLRAASETERQGRDFQERLWEDNWVASTGQGNIALDQAFDDQSFRNWFAARSMMPLPSQEEARAQFLNELYQDIKGHLEPFLAGGRIPRLKILRVMAVLYPQVMTSIADVTKLARLVRDMAGPRAMTPAERHLWVRHRIDQVLGPPGADSRSLALRVTLPWRLYEKYVMDQTNGTTPPDERLHPLPAARRRRGLTATKGGFPAALSALEFIQDGVTRQDLIEFLRAASPDVKSAVHAMTINVLQSELGAVRTEGDKYVLTERGANALESGDATDLSDWLLTHILGVDKALVELRDHGPLKPAELMARIRTMNPGWSGNFVPNAILFWLRSMGVIQTNGQWQHELTDLGRSWAARVHWEPEPLQPEVSAPAPPPPADEGATAEPPPLSSIITRVQVAGHFPGELIAKLHAGLWSHPRRHFAILTGLSGAGKTLLAREYAKALTPAEADPHLLTFPVQPGWYDPGALLGYVNPLRADSYVTTPFLDFLLEASANPGRPSIVVLDEMNLSHPEQYMAPLLSAMETGEAIPLHSEDDVFDGIPRALPYPSNLVIIGTVNMDETTHGLSDKVLDRAFVLEFWQVNLDDYPRWETRKISKADEDSVRKMLTALVNALQPARLHFGWRVVDDVLDFLERASESSDILPFHKALDGCVYAKILPKLRGEDSARIREALDETKKVLEQFGLTDSLAKVAELRRDLETTGSARFWR